LNVANDIGPDVGMTIFPALFAQTGAIISKQTAQPRAADKPGVKIHCSGSSGDDRDQIRAGRETAHSAISVGGILFTGVCVTPPFIDSVEMLTLTLNV